MGLFREYMSSEGAVQIGVTELNELVDRHEWFSAARAVRMAQTQVRDGRLEVVQTSRAVGAWGVLAVDVRRLLSLSSEELIDRFLQEDDLRIVAEQGEPETEVRMEAELAEEDDLVSEELAEIYLAQGLRDEALKIYRKLSLLNSEKSVYFAQIIERIETNN